VPYTTIGKNRMLDQLGVDRVGAFDADAGKAVTAVAATDVFTSAGHGYANGDIVVLSGIAGGAGARVAYPYFVIGQTANTFQLAEVPAGAAINLTSDMTSGTVTRLTELSGGAPAYARKAIAYAAAAGGVIDDSTNGAVIDVPAGATVDWLGYWNNATGELRAISQQTPEGPYGAQGTYTVTDAKHDLNS
jgi:hypothetical protein